MPTPLKPHFEPTHSQLFEDLVIGFPFNMNTFLQCNRDLALTFWNKSGIESAFGTRLACISLGAEPGLAAASGCVHKLINCESRFSVTYGDTSMAAGRWLPILS